MCDHASDGETIFPENSTLTPIFSQSLRKTTLTPVSPSHLDPDGVRADAEVIQG